MTTKSPNALPAAVLVLAALFVLTIGITVNYTYMDEAYFADPVINFLRGNGYTTTAWNVTSQFETHVSSAPAYSLLLLVWLKFFGITQTSVRSLSAAVALGSALVLWRACLRSGLIKSGLAGAMLIGVLILDYGYAYSYTCGRPDSLSALVVATMFYLSTLQNQRLALGALGAISIVVPFVQWSCVIYLGLLSIALVLIIPREKALKYLVVVGAGIVVGLLMQRIIYSHLGLWDAWMNTLKSEGAESIVGRIKERMTLTALVRGRHSLIPRDISALVVLAGMALVYVRSKLLDRQEGVRLGKSAWIIAIIVTLGMYFVAKFPTYYGWMLGLPCAAILGSYFDRVRPERRLETGIAACIASVACAVGLPLQAGVALHDWNERTPAAITAWLAPKISTNDVVYCDYPFYYIAKERAKLVFSGYYGKILTPAEFNEITVAIVMKNQSEWKPPEDILNRESIVGEWRPVRSGILGNNWEYGLLSVPNYNCTVYRLK